MQQLSERTLPCITSTCTAHRILYKQLSMELNGIFLFVHIQQRRAIPIAKFVMFLWVNETHPWINSCCLMKLPISLLLLLLHSYREKKTSRNRDYFITFSVFVCDFLNILILFMHFFLVFQNKIHTSANWLQTAFELAGFVSQEIVCYLSSFLVQYARLLNLIVLKNTDNNSIEEKKSAKPWKERQWKNAWLFVCKAKASACIQVCLVWSNLKPLLLGSLNLYLVSPIRLMPIHTRSFDDFTVSETSTAFNTY